MRATLLRVILFLLLAHTIQSQDTATNITISNTNASITYTPFLCDVSASSDSCAGGWTPSGSVVSTFGPADAGGDIIPQMFFRAHASAIFLTTSSLSNATLNVTIFQTPTTVEQTFSPPISIISVVDLNEAKETIFTITYLSGGRLDIGTIMLTVNSQSSTALPTLSLPPTPTIIRQTLTSTSASATNTSTTSSSAGPSSSRSSNLGLAIGIPIGIGLGGALLSVLVFLFIRRQSGRRTPDGLRLRQSRCEGGDGHGGGIRGVWMKRIGLGRGTRRPQPRGREGDTWFR